MVAARTVRRGRTVATVVTARLHASRLVGGAQPVGGDPRRGVRRGDRDVVQRERQRGRAEERPGLEPGASRRGSAQRRFRSGGWHPRLPRAQPDGAGRSHERQRADRRADRRADPARRSGVRRLGRRADPAGDRRRHAGVPGPCLHRRVGLGQAQDPAPARVRDRPSHPGHDHRLGVPAGDRRRPGPRGRAVRDQLRADRARARGRVRSDLPQQRGPAGRRADGAAGDGRPRPDPAAARLRVLRDLQRPARADPAPRGEVGSRGSWWSISAG